MKFSDLKSPELRDAARRAKGIADRYIREDGTTPEPRPDAAEIEAAAKLSATEYDRERGVLAELLGVRVSTLDKEVSAARKAKSSAQGSAVTVEEVEAWPEKVDGAALLDEMAAAITAHIALKEVEAHTIALWCLYTHAYAQFPVSPRLGIRAATAECGKTEALRRIRRFVNRPLECDGLTAAVFFRLIDTSKPTLLVDELDNILPEDKSAILGAMNSGYSRKGRVFRCVGDNNDVRAFSTFAPFVYAMIGKPTGTFDSRTIAIELRRAPPEKARTLTSLEDDSAEDARLADMGRKAARWIADNMAALKARRPDMGGLVNRPAMNWRPLFVVADLAGGTWPERARRAAAAASTVRADQDIKAELIIDLKAVMDAALTVDEWPSAMLVEQLVGLEGRPWAEFGKTLRPITQSRLARWLNDFGIRPTDIGPRDARRKGYRRWQFDDAFASYAPSPDSSRAPAHNAMDAEQLDRLQPRTEESECADEKCEKSNNGGLVRGCAASEDGWPREGYAEAPEDGLSIPKFLRRRLPDANQPAVVPSDPRPALGPAGDDLADFDG